MNENINHKTSEQNRFKAKEYYQKNKGKCLMQSKEYYNKHKDEILKKMKLQYDAKEKGNYDKQRYIKNKTKIREKANLYYHNNKNKRKNYLLKTKYGLSLEEYKNKWINQDGKCEICNKEFLESDMFPKSHGLVVDHNHTTHQIRGLLCNSCNRALGLFHDNYIIIKKANEYLTKWNTTYAI